jgi:flavin-dependent dehydrogenase
MRRVDQQSLEAILGERAAALGIELRRGCEVTSVEQYEDSVEVRWASPAGPDHARCAWLVGCDGGGAAAAVSHSSLGSAFERSFHSIDQRICGNQRMASR